MKPRITVVDYGLGNLHSVINALVHVGADVDVAKDAEGIYCASHILLPGVGAFADGMAGLRERGQVEALQAYAAKGLPLLGICLGAQLLLDASEEFGDTAGLGIIPGKVIKVDVPKAKVPHVGWERLHITSAEDSASLLNREHEEVWAYFVHSYHAQPKEEKHIIATVDYQGSSITAAIGRDQILGCQFHPEKSGQPGLNMLKTFIHL